MKFYLPVFMLGLVALVALCPALHAKPRAQTKVDARELGKGIKVAKPLSLKKRVGERIRFKMWAEGLPRPNFSNHMQDTSSYKPFGTLLVGGETWWSVAKPPKGEENNTLNHRAGQRIEITSDSAHNGGRDFVAEIGYGETQWRKFKLSLMLYDFAPTYLVPPDMTREQADEVHRENDYNYDHPPLMGRFENSFDLSQMKKGDYVWTWSDGGRESSKFHLRIEHVGYLYKIDYPRLDPAIEKPKISDHITGPGPISKTRPRVVQPLVKERTQR